MTSCAVFVFALGSTSHALATSGTADPDVQLYMDEFSLTRIDAAQQVSDRERLSPAIEAVYAHPDDFAGAYVTHEGGLTVHILYAAGEELARQTVQGAVGASGQVDYAPAKYSLASLRLEQLRIGALAGAFAEAGTRLVAVSRDTENNRLEVEVDGSAAIASQIVGQSDVPLLISESKPLEPTSCTSPSNCTPWRGGILIHPDDGTGLDCTFGYSARKRGGTQLYMITAGHCDETETETWTHHGGTIGTTTLNNLLTSGSTLGDGERVPRTNTSTPLNVVYQYDFYTTYPITSVDTYNNQVDGDPVFMTGYVSGTKSGTITNDDYLANLTFRGSQKLVWTKKVGTLMAHGDSGGPTYSNHKGYGIVTAIGSDFTVYSTLELLEDALDVDICTSSSC